MNDITYTLVNGVNVNLYMKFHPSLLTTMLEDVANSRVLESFVEVTFHDDTYAVPAFSYLDIETVPWGAKHLISTFIRGRKQIMLPRDARHIWKRLVEMGWKRK